MNPATGSATGSATDVDRRSRAAVVLGAASVVGVVFTLYGGDFQLVRMSGAGQAVLTVVLGLLAIGAGLTRSRSLILGAGVLFLLTSLLLLVLLALDATGGWLHANGSPMSFWAGLGVGLVALGATPAEPRPTDSGARTPEGAR